LAAGTYELSLPDETPVRPTARVAGPIRYRAQIRHKDGTDVVWVEPLTSRVIGTFTFDEGRHGFVHIDTGGAAGLVVADAIRFHRTAATSTRK
jgi:hypothetical protein